MFLNKIRQAWKKRVFRHLMKNNDIADWCTFVKALCGSWEDCRGFPYSCKLCFDFYFNVDEILQNVLEQ